MSWGRKIAIVYIGFVLMIAALIFRSARENTDLDSADYYERELRFQEQIDGSLALNNTGKKPLIDVFPAHIEVQLPAEIGADPNGYIQFYGPVNAKLDRKFEVTAAISQYEISDFVSGSYTVRMTWTDVGEAYYYETKIYVP